MILFLALTLAGAPHEEIVLERAVPEPVSLRPPVFPADLPPHTSDTFGIVRCTVGADGTVVQAEIVKSIGPREDEAIMQVAVTWIFKPAIHRGAPLQAQVDVPVHIETHLPEKSVQSNTNSRSEMTTVVKEKTPPPPPLAAGDLDIAIGKLQAVPRPNAAKLLTLAPGVLLTNHGGEGHAPRIFLRGFDAGEGKDIDMQLQGIPLNDVSNSHGHGYVDSNLIIPEVVHRLRVTEGNLNASQGDFAIAGTVNFQLGIAERGSRVKWEYGAFNEMRGVGYWAPKGYSDSSFLAAQWKQGSGFGPSRSHTSGTFVGQWDLLATDTGKLKLLGAMSAGRFASAGVIRQDDLVFKQLPCGDSTREQFFCTYDSNQGGAQQRQLLSLDYEGRVGTGRLTQQVYYMGRSMRLQENFTGFVNDLPPSGESQRGDNTELAYQGHTLGLKGAFRSGSQEKTNLELGYIARHDDVSSSSRRRRFGTSIPYRVVFDNDVNVSYLAAYAQTQWAPNEKWRLRGGLRLDTFFFGVRDNNRPDLDREGARLTSEYIEAYGVQPSPKASIEYRFTDNVAWLTGGGLGARSSDASALSENEFAPFAQVASIETGLRWTKKTDKVEWDLRAAGYGTRVAQDFVFSETAGRNQPVGASNRLGVFGLARLWGNTFDVQGNLAYAYATLPQATSAAWKLWEGTPLPYVPRLLGRLDASVFRDLEIKDQKFRGTLALGSSYIGPRPLPFNTFAEPIFLLDAFTSVKWKFIEAGLSVENILDARWKEAEFNYISNFQGPDSPASRLPMRHFSAGAPRLWRLSLAFHFDS